MSNWPNPYLYVFLTSMTTIDIAEDILLIFAFTASFWAPPKRPPAPVVFDLKDDV